MNVESWVNTWKMEYIWISLKCDMQRFKEIPGLSKYTINTVVVMCIHGRIWIGHLSGECGELGKYLENGIYLNFTIVWYTEICIHPWLAQMHHQYGGRCLDIPFNGIALFPHEYWELDKWLKNEVYLNLTKLWYPTDSVLSQLDGTGGTYHVQLWISDFPEQSAHPLNTLIFEYNYAYILHSFETAPTAFKLRWI